MDFTPQGKKAMEAAKRFSKKMQHNYVGTEHLLYGLTKDTILTDEEFASVANIIAPSKNQQLSKK